MQRRQVESMEGQGGGVSEEVTKGDWLQGSTMKAWLCSCEFRDYLCPGFAPNPFCFSFWFWGFLSWSFFGRSGRCRLRGVASLRLLAFVAMRYACVKHA